MARSNRQVQGLEERLAGVRGEIEKLRAQETLLLDLIREAKGEPKVRLRAPRQNMKQTVLSLLERVGDEGLNATSAVQIAAQDNITLERGSVSSLLSRMKHDGVLDYDGSVYRLADRRGAVVHPIRTSGAVM